MTIMTLNKISQLSVPERIQLVQDIWDTVWSVPENLELTDISEASTFEEIADFWDTHSLDDYWDQTQEAEFTVTAKQGRRITLVPEVYTRIEAQARAAFCPKHWSTYGWLSGYKRQDR